MIYQLQIKKLPLEISSLLAAGQVIDSLAAVVRELIENSLDAQANRIIISLYPEAWRVQVADNGLGMSLEDLRLCAQSYSTSKIGNSDDLSQITSLGFRGEGLYALAQLADIEICSRATSDDAVGWRVVYRAGKLTEEVAIAIASGTIVTVSNLFGDWLTRRESLPTVAQQLKAIQEIISKAALCHPTVAWQLKVNHQLLLSISPGDSALQIVPQILKQARSSDLQLIQREDIELIIGLPDRCHRRRNDWVKVALNGRIVRFPELEQTIISAFARTLPRDRYPVCFVHLQVPPQEIDWNRHPAKLEIYLHSLQFWQDKIKTTIEEALRISAANLPASVENQRVEKLLKVAEDKATYHLDTNLPVPTAEIGLIDLKAVGQVNNTYIVAEYAAGLWLIEQHIAHERVLYERIQNHWQIVALKTPIILTQLRESQLEQLQRLELDIEPFGEQMWAVRSAPEMLHERSDCAQALLELSHGGDLQTAQVAIACRSAIRNGTPLSLAEMQNLVEQWKNTRNPRTCPHGRPIYLSLEETSLARFFRRNWVIGKSHGI